MDESAVSRPSSKSGCSVRVRETPCPGESQAELAERVARAFPGLIQTRNANWLAWRFGARPRARYRSFLATDISGSPAAWVVTAAENRAGYKIGYVVDLVSVDECAGVGVGTAALRALLDDGVDVVMAVVRALPSLVRPVQKGGIPARSAATFTEALLHAFPAKSQGAKDRDGLAGPDGRLVPDAR